MNAKVLLVLINHPLKIGKMVCESIVFIDVPGGF